MEGDGEEKEEPEPEPLYVEPTEEELKERRVSLAYGAEWRKAVKDISLLQARLSRRVLVWTRRSQAVLDATLQLYGQPR